MRVVLSTDRIIGIPGPAMYRFLHAADLHLDSPFKGLERYESAPVEAFRSATRRAFTNLVDLALREKVGFVLIAGDLFDGEWTDYGSGLFLNREWNRLRDAGIRVVTIRGNHDAANLMTRSLRPPDNVNELAYERAESLELREFGVVIHGQGFASRAVTANLAAAYPRRCPGVLNIGMLHTSADGRPGHEPYAPCTLDDMAAKEYGYWALGHIHTREVLGEDPPIVFPGNIQGRHARETGAKGCTLVTYAGDRVRSFEHRDVDVMRWDARRVDATGVRDEDELEERIRGVLVEAAAGRNGRPTALRLEIVGATGLHERIVCRPDYWAAAARSRALEVADGAIWIEKVRLKTGPESRSPVEEGPIGELLAYLDEARGSEEELRRLGDELRELRRKLPENLREGADAIDLESAGRLRELLDDVRPLLLHGLTGGTLE